MPSAILRCASWLVPAEQRADWLAEWIAELWYVHDSRVVFCLGSFRDAWWLRRHAPLRSRLLRFESPRSCLVFLALAAAASFVLALALPETRDLILAPGWSGAPGLVLITAHTPEGPIQKISVQQYRTWVQTTRGRFTTLAFYQPDRWQVVIGGHPAELSLARTNARLFEVLKVPVSSAAPAVLLSRSAWRRYFHSESSIVGRVLEIDGQSATVAGVVREEDWRLPGRIDAWLIEDEPHFARLPADARGFVVGHLAAAALRPPSGVWHMMLPGEQGSSSDFDCILLSDPTPPRPFFALVMMAVATCLIVRTNASVSFGRIRRLGQLVFLSAKIALLVPIVVLGAVDIATLLGMVLHVHLEPPMVVTAWILAARWLVRDQQERCPVCLRLLVNPIPIGQASQTFLGWYGTEFMCAKGHGLLQVPEIPSSSSSASSWIQLDPSWSGLF